MKCRCGKSEKVYSAKTLLLWKLKKETMQLVQYYWVNGSKSTRKCRFIAETEGLG